MQKIKIMIKITNLLILSLFTLLSQDLFSQELTRYVVTNGEQPDEKFISSIRYGGIVNLTGDRMKMESPSPGKTFYIQKSKNQKKAAKIILISGLGIAAIGGIVQLNHENQRAGTFDFDFTGTWIAVAGGAVALMSVPFFICSGSNARKAAALSIGNQSIFIPQPNQTMARTDLPTLSFKIIF